MSTRCRYLNGYRLVYDPTYHRAMTSDNWRGFVYEHIKLAEIYNKRVLAPNEVVHHLDGDRLNNSRDNLLIVDRGQHNKIHNWLERGAPGIERFRMNGVNSEKSNATSSPYCRECSNVLTPDQQVFCSVACQRLGSRKVSRPDKEQLAADMLCMPLTRIGEKYGVSDNAVRKWAKQYGLL